MSANLRASAGADVKEEGDDTVVVVHSSAGTVSVDAEGGGADVVKEGEGDEAGGEEDEEVVGGASPLQRVPSDVWCIVFSLLDPETLLTAVPQVCKQWRNACQDLTEVHLDFRWFPKQRPSNLLKALLGTWQKDSVKASTFLTGLCNIFPFAASLKVGPNIMRQHIDDAFVHTLARGCRGFKEANFYKCDHISNGAIVALAKGCPLITLVDFSYCRNLTDAAVIAFAKGCPQITSITFAHCYDLSDKALISIAEGCPRLTTVNVPYVSNLTDKAVITLAERCPLITKVNFKFCVYLTDAAMEALLKNCAGLTRENISVSCCTKLSDEVLFKFPSA